MTNSSPPALLKLIAQTVVTFSHRETQVYSKLGTLSQLFLVPESVTALNPGESHTSQSLAHCRSSHWNAESTYYRQSYNLMKRIFNLTISFSNAKSGFDEGLWAETSAIYINYQHLCGLHKRE